MQASLRIAEREHFIQSKQIQGVALPQKERIGQVGESIYHGTHHPQSLELVCLPEQELNGTVLLKVVMQSQIGSGNKPLFSELQ